MLGSRTVRLTGYSPALVYTWVALAAVAAVPSPNSQRYVSGSPSGSRDCEALNVIGRPTIPPNGASGTATGGLLGPSGTTWTRSVLWSPRTLSSTPTVRFPARHA